MCILIIDFNCVLVTPCRSGQYDDIIDIMIL